MYSKNVAFKLNRDSFFFFFKYISWENKGSVVFRALLRICKRILHPQTVVPPYEVVPVLHTVHKRSVDAKPKIHLKAFGKDISLSLKPTEGLLTANSLPMWTVTRNTSQPDGLHYERVKNVSDLLSAYLIIDILYFL